MRIALPYIYKTLQKKSRGSNCFQHPLGKKINIQDKATENKINFRKSKNYKDITQQGL